LALTGFVASGTLTYSASGLPGGLSIDSGTGVISGTLAAGTAQAAPYSVTVTASDGAASNSVTFSWSVTALMLPLPPDQGNLDGDSVSLLLGAHSHGTATLRCSASGLPTGLSLNTSTGVISGTLASNADADGPYSVTVTATAGGDNASQTFTWDV